MKPLDLPAQFKGLNIPALTVLDVGCGNYTSPISSQMRKLPFAKLISVDVHAPVIIEIMRKKHILDFKCAEHTVSVFDGTDLALYEREPIDVIIFLDVIEHINKQAGVAVLKKAMEEAKKRVLIWIPLEECPQGELDNNPHQKHVSSWTKDELEELGFEVTVFSRFHRQFTPPVDAAWAIYNRSKKLPRPVLEEPVLEESSLED